MGHHGRCGWDTSVSVAVSAQLSCRSSAGCWAGQHGCSALPPPPAHTYSHQLPKGVVRSLDVIHALAPGMCRALGAHSPRCFSLRLSPRRCTRSSSEELNISPRFWVISVTSGVSHSHWHCQQPAGVQRELLTTASTSLATSTLSAHTQQAGWGAPSTGVGLLSSPGMTGATAQPLRATGCMLPHTSHLLHMFLQGLHRLL